MSVKESFLTIQDGIALEARAAHDRVQHQYTAEGLGQLEDPMAGRTNAEIADALSGGDYAGYYKATHPRADGRYPELTSDGRIRQTRLENSMAEDLWEFAEPLVIIAAAATGQYYLATAAGLTAAGGAGLGGSVVTSGAPSLLSQAAYADIALGGAGGTIGGEALIAGGFGASGAGGLTTLKSIVDTARQVQSVASSVNTVNRFLNPSVAGAGLTVLTAPSSAGGTFYIGQAPGGRPLSSGAAVAGQAPAPAGEGGFFDSVVGQVAIGVLVALVLAYMGAR